MALAQPRPLAYAFDAFGDGQDAEFVGDGQNVSGDAGRLTAWYSFPAPLSTTEDCESSVPPVRVTPELANTPGLVCR